MENTGNLDNLLESLKSITNTLTMAKTQGKLSDMSLSLNKIANVVLNDVTIFKEDFIELYLELIKIDCLFNNITEKYSRENYIVGLKSLLSNLKLSGGIDQDVVNVQISYYDLVLSPVLKDIVKTGDSYKKYNIDISFFNNLRLNSSYGICQFVFNKYNKLSSFTLCEPGSNMKHTYNSKYALSKITFSDGEVMLINNKTSKKKSFKSVTLNTTN